MPHHTTTPARAAGAAESKVVAALRAHPGSTVAEIAHAAGVGRSTAGKILATAEHRGRVQRTPGSLERGGRTPDRWNAITDHAKPARLARGALRGVVADYLAAYPGVEFGPVAIGKALNRSSGAIANALATLTATRQAIQTSDRPVRYTSAAADKNKPTDGNNTHP